MNYLQKYGNDEINNYKVVISGAGGTIQGILDTESFGIDYSVTLSDSMLGDAKGGFIKGLATAGIKKVLGDFGAGLLEKAGVQRFGSTIQTWGGSGNPSFSIPILILPGAYGSSSFSEVNKTLTHWTMPKAVSDVLWTNLYTPGVVKGLLTNPKALDGDLISIHIGNWFSTDSVFFVTGASQSYTTITDDSGKPLYLKLNLSFTAYRQILSDEANKWING